MVSSTARQIISLAISLLIVVISLTDVAQGATEPTNVTKLERYAPGFAGAPGKMARDDAGNFYVTDFWGKGIVKLNRHGVRAGFIATLGRPSAVAVLPDNRLVVAMTAPQPYVAFYSQHGSFPDVTGEESGTFETPSPAFYRPIGITVDDYGYIYVLDAGDSSSEPTDVNFGRIRVYESIGSNAAYRYFIGARTNTNVLATTYDNRLKQPAGIAYEKVGHNIVVADTMNGRLLFFSEYDGISMAAVSSIGKSSSGGGTGAPPSIGSTIVTFGNPVDVAFEYDAVPTLQRIYVAERARNEISVLDATTNKSTKYINGTEVSGATMKHPNSVLFEKTATGGVLYTNNAATSSPADVLSLSIDGGAIPGAGATLTIKPIASTVTLGTLSVSGNVSPVNDVTCSVNGGAYFPTSLDDTTPLVNDDWKTNSNLTLQTGANYILCKSTIDGLTSFAEAATYFDPAPVDGPTVTIAGPATAYSNNASLTVSGTTGAANAFVKVDGSISGTCSTTSNANSSWSCELTLPEGSNLLTASAWKTGSTVITSNVVTVVVDVKDPDMTVTGKISFLDNGATTTNAVQNLDGIVFDVNLSSVEVNGVEVLPGAKVTLTGNRTYFSTPVILNRGLNTVTVTATDLAGRSATLLRTVTLNPEIPGLTVALPADNSYRPAGTTTATASGTVNTAFTLVDAAGTSVTPTDGNWSTAAMTVASDVFGSYKFTASGGGNATVTEKRSINANTDFAQLAITSPAADLATNSSSVVISGSVAAETVAAPTISVSGGATITDSTYTQGTGIFSHTVTFPAQGTYSVKVAADAATTAVRNIIYDTTLPEITIQADSKISPTMISGLIDPSAKISKITGSLGTGSPFDIPVVYPFVQFTGSVVWHANLNGYPYDTVTFTAISPAGNEKSLTRKAGIPTGDIDGDGVVRLSDALAALRHVAGTEPFIENSNKKFQADVGALVEGRAGQDGVVDITDAVLILGKSYGLLSF